MTRLGILGVTSLALAMLASVALAQSRGGAVSGGMRGGVATGAKIGLVTGATRAAINRESQARTEYQATTEYQNAQRSNFNETPPEVLGATAAGTAKKPSEEAVIRKNGKPIVGITFPTDWNQKAGDNYISAVSGDGQAYSMLVALDGVADKQAGIEKVKTGLAKYLNDIQYDEPSETKEGAVVVTGTGKGKKAGVDIVFAAGLFEAAKGQLVGAAFVVDSKVEDHYKDTIRGICETIRRAEDFGK